MQKYLQSMIKIIDPISKTELQETEKGLTDSGGKIIYPYINGAHRLVSDENYASSFGIEWNTFQRTQIDKYNDTHASQERFFAQTKWEIGKLEGENILEVGSGAGRFTHIILDYTKANLYSVDYSNAVEANFKNNGANKRLHLFQASIYELPFAKESFDKVFCFGVLQHTPDFKKSIKCLAEMVKPGGELIVDFYAIKGWYTKVNAKYILRPFIKNLSHKTLMKIIRNNVDWLIGLYKFNQSIGLGVLNRFVPICDIKNTLPSISKESIKEWIILDTFDMFSPQYDNPQRITAVKQWFIESGMKNITGGFIKYGKNLSASVVKGIKN